MKTLKTIVGCALTAALCVFTLAAQAAEKSVKWSLPGDWESGAECAGMVRGLGEVGAPDLPAFRYTVTMPKGAKLTGVTFDAAWKEVEGVPSPVAEPVTSGQKLVYPEPGPQFNEVYPASAAYALEAMISGNKILQPIVITPYKWDGPTKTLYKATRLDVTITYTEPRTLKLTTSSVNDVEGEVLILSPHNFVSLWQGYAAFRKSTDAGKNFTFTVKDTKEIYDYPGLTDREKTDYALALHHYIETNFYKAASCDKQYIILGASPAKTATFNPNTMIPKRDFFGDSGTSTHDYNQAGDMYYGCMERLKDGQIDPSVEVWDYGNDGVYWAAQNTSPYNFDPANCVDWTMEIAVTRVPLLERSVEKLGSSTIERTAAQMMDAFTNRIAWAESAAFETADRGKAYVGGNENEGNQKGGKDERYTGERTFFDGITNIFDPSRNGKITSDEWGPRDRVYNIMGKVQPQRDAKIIACNISNTDIAGAYSSRGDLATFYSHGDWREYGNLSASRAYQGGGFYAVYATSFSCMSGKYDTNGDGAGITNALCFGEAPIVAPVREDGALITLTSARDGWSGGFGTLSMWLDELFLKALYGLADGVPMNAAQAGKYAHNTYAAQAKGTTSAHGSVLGHAILCGDPLIKVFMMPNRTALTGYSRNLSVSTASSKTFDIAGDVAAARAAFSDVGNQTLTLQGTGKFRTTDTLTVTNVANLVWNVAGGAGRNGIAFVGQAGRLTLPGNAVRYFGPKLTNVDEISVTGGNVTLDFDTTACSFAGLSFVGGGQGTDRPTNNVLRTRAEGFIPAAQTIPVVNSALKLQTINIGGNTAALKDTPLFYVTNGVLTVESNPYWGTEYFVRPTYLSNAKILGEYADFGLGRPDSNGYDLYVDGTSEIGGSTPIKVTGELRLHLEDAATTLTITNVLANGHNGAAGSVVVSGAGKVVLATSPTLTGGVTIEGGIALELPKIPLTSGGTITLESGAKLLLPEPSSSGIYNVYSGDAKLVLGDGVKVYKASAPETEIKGRFVNGNFVPDDAVIYWKTASGTWQDSASVTTCWTNSSGQAVGFTNGQSVFFGPVASAASVSVTASSVSTDYAEVNAPGWNYTFSGTASPTLLTIVSAAYMDNTSTINARKVEVVEGASFHMHKQSKLNGIGNRTVRALTFSFSEARSSDQRVAIQELRLFQGSTFFPMPTGTIIEDCAGNKIRITGYVGGDNWAHSYEWIKGTDGNESLRALIDGVLGNQNKWWASSSAAPTWFTITFPTAQNAITGYNLRTADSAGRNPKSWTVSVSDDGLAYTKERAQSGVDFGGTGSWMSGDGTAKAYDLMTDSRGVLHVQKGGTLVSEGNARVDVTFDEGAILKLVGGAVSLFRPNDSTYCFLNLPENGGVYVSAEGLSASSGNEVLYGYNLTDADVAKFTPADNVTLSLSSGNLYATVDNKKCGPFKTTLTTGTGATPSWTTLAWKDRYGGSITWDSSLQYSTSATAALNVESLPSGGATLNLNYAATLGTLKLTGGSTETITLSWSAACVPAVIDLTEYDGKVVLAPGSNLTSATEIIANENTEINGTGIAAKLTIGADKKATVEYPWSGTKTVATGGTIAYDNNTSSSVLALGNLKIDGATVELAGTHTIDGSFAVNVDNTKIVSSGTVSTESGDNEVILSNNAKSIFEVTGGELILQGRVRIRKDSVGKLILSGGEIKAGDGFLYPGGGYGGDSMDFTITGGAFSAPYNAFRNQLGCDAKVNISGGVFAPANLWTVNTDGAKPTTDDTAISRSGSNFAVNMTGGTFSAPAGVPNWLPINVTAGSANLGPQNAGTTTIRSLLTIDGGATLNITAGIISFAGSGALKGTGTLAIGSGATFTTAYGSLSNNVTVAAGGTLNLTGAALTESGITITEGTFSKADGATLQINGTELDMTQWTIEGNRIVKRQSGQYGPLMSELWHQHNPYDDLAPVLEGQQAPCGCVATATAQMFHHYAWPKRLNGVTAARTTYKNSGGGYSDLDLAVNGYEPFDYDAMTNTAVVAGAYQAARFVIWCDALAKMQFNPRGVGSNTPFYWVPEATTYWYEKGYEVNPSTAGDCSALVKAEVAAGRPVQTTISGHQVVIDGWRASDGYFHVNWGQQNTDPEKTTYYRMNGAWLGDWQIASLWVGLTPRIMAQIEPISSVSSSSVTLNWDFPAARTNEVSGFKVRDYVCATSASDYDVGEPMVLDRSSADYYPIPGAFVLTSSSEFSCSVESSYVVALDVVVQMRLNGGDWMDIATPELSRKESYWDKEVFIDNTMSTPVRMNLAAYAGQFAEFRFKTIRTGNSIIAPTSLPYLYVGDISFAQVKAPGAPTERTLGADARSVTIDGLSVDSCHAFTVTPITNGVACVTSEAVSTRIVAEEPTLPEILGVTTMGSPMTDGFRRTCKPGGQVYFVQCSAGVTNLKVTCSHTTYAADSAFHVIKCEQPGYFVFYVEELNPTSGSQMLYTIAASDANGNTVHKDLQVTVSQDATGDEEGWLINGLKQDNVFIVPPGTETELPSDFNRPVVGSGTNTFHNVAPTGSTYTDSLRDWMSWHGTVKLVDCPKVADPSLYKNENSFLVEEKSPEPPGPTPTVKVISYKDQTLPKWTTDDSGLYDLVYRVFKEGGKLELAFTMNYSGNKCGAFQCIFHAGKAGTGFSIYENGGPHLLFSQKNNTNAENELYQDLTAGDHQIVYRFENNGTDSANISIDIDGTRYESMTKHTWSWSDMSWSSTEAERNEYSMGCRAPDDTSTHPLQTSTILNNTITATYTPPQPEPTNAAKIGDTEYATVAAAIEAVTTGQTITLLKSVEEDLASVAKTFTLALDGHTLSGTLGLTNAGVITLNYGTNGALASTVTGSGMLIYDATLMTTFPTTAPTGLTADAWTGTVWFKGYNSDSADRTVASFRNASSTVKFTSVKGFFAAASVFSTVSLEDAGDTPALNLDNGYGGWGSDKHIEISNLTGTGTLKASWGGGGYKGYPLTLVNLGDFHGSLSTTQADGIGIYVGPKLSSWAQADNGKITLVAGGTATIAGGKTWTAVDGIQIDGKIGGSGTLASDTTFGDGAEIDNRNGILNATGTLTFGASTKVRVAMTPTGDIQIINKSGTTAGDISTTVSVYVGESTTAETGDYKLAYKTDGVYLIYTAPEPESPVLVWEGNSATTSKALSLAVEKGKAFTLIVQMTNTTSTLVGAYLNGKISAGQSITPFCVATDTFTDFNTSANIPNSSLSFRERKSGGWRAEIGSRAASGNASWSENIIGNDLNCLAVIYAAYSGTVAADGSVSDFKCLFFSRLSGGTVATREQSTTPSFSISDSLDTMNVKSDVGDIAFKVYLDYHVRTVDQIKQAIADIENPPGPTPTNAAKIGDVEYETVAAAIEAVTTGQTITLLKNCSEAALSAGDKTFTLDLASYSLTGTLTIGGSGAVTLTTLPAANTLKIAGSGRLVYNSTTIPTLNNIWDSSWTGTFAYGGYDGEAQNWNPTSYFNGTASKFEFGGTVKTKGWFWQSSSANNMFGELVLTGTINFTDGHTHPKDDNDPILHYCFTKLSGGGTITINTSSSATTALRFSDVSAYTGALSVDSTNGSGNGYRVFLGNGTLEASGNNPTRVAIHVTGNATLGTATYTAKNGIIVHNPASVGGTATLASATTFEDGAEITTTNGVLTANGALTFGASTKVRVATTPAGDVKIINKSGTTAGEIDTTVSVYVGDSETAETREYKLAYKTDGVYLIPGESPYAKFDYGTVYSWATTGSSAVDLAGASDFYEFDIVGCTNKTTVYHGSDTTTGTAKFWHRFAYASTVNEHRGAIIRLQQGSYCTTIGGTYGAMSFGGIIAEAGDTNYKIEQTSGTRDTILGDPTAATNTFFDIGASVTFNRNGKFALAGTLTFDIASGKATDLNSSRSTTLQLVGTVAPSTDGNYGATTAGGTLVMKGEGTLTVKTLQALGSTLDYRNLPYNRANAYISGTLTINDATVIKLPADLPENTAFKMATTLSGANTGDRTIWIGETEAVKYVTFDAASGTISYTDAAPYKTLGWDAAQSAWTNAEGVVTAVDNTCILNAKAGDVITFASAVTPHQFNMPESGTVTLGTGGNLMNYAITVPSGATLALGWNSSDAYAQVISGAGAVDITGAMVQLSADNTFAGALTIKDGGYLKMGANNCLNASNAATVDAGGMLDINGKKELGALNFTLAGGALVNNGSNITHGEQQMASITLTANSTVGGTGNFGLVTANYNATTLTLNGHTLTKTGSGTFWLCNTTIGGTGTLAIQDGTVDAHNDKACTFADGTLLLISGGTFAANAGKAVTIPSLTVTSGTVSGSGSISGLATLKGSVDFSTFTGTITLADTVSIGTASADETVTLGNASTEGKTLTVLGGTLNLMKDGVQRAVGALTLAEGSTLMVSTNTTAAAVQVNGDVNLTGVNVAVAGVLPESGAKVYLLGATSITGTGTLVNPGAWTVAVADNTLTATKKPSTYITPGDGGTVSHASDVTDSLDISKELAKKVTKDMPIKVKDDSPAETVVEAMNQEGANGYKVWESAVLGLDPTNAASQLVISPTVVQGEDPSKVTLKVPTVNVDTTTGADVTFCFWSKDGDGEWKEVSGGAVESGKTKELDLPTEGVKYFQLRTTIKTQAQVIPTVIPSANIVAAGAPVMTTPGTQYAASMGTKTLDAAAESLDVELAGAGVYEGQEYHLEVTEGASNSSSHFAIVAKATTNTTKHVTFYFGKEVPVGTTCKLTLLSANGAPNGNIVVETPGFEGVTYDNVMVTAMLANRPHLDDLGGEEDHTGYRIPAVATDGNGEVIACYDVRDYKSSGWTDLGHDTGIDVGESYSKDRGVSFNPPKRGINVPNCYAHPTKLADYSKHTDMGDVCMVWDPSREQYWILGMTGNGLAGSNTNLNDVVVYTRTRGETSEWTAWHNPDLAGVSESLDYRSIQHTVLSQVVGSGSSGKGFLQGPGHGMVTKIGKGDTMPAGTVVFPVQYFIGTAQAGAIYLKPGTPTVENNWKATGRTTADGSQENCIMELDDGSWYMMCKKPSQGTGDPNRYKAWRTVDFTKWVDVDDGLSGVAAVEGSCLRIGVDKDGVGQYVFCHVNASTRRNLTMFFGHDTTKGETGTIPSTTNKGIQWDMDNPLVIDSTDSGGMMYNSLCMLDDHTIGVLYEYNWHIYFTRIDVSDKVVGPTAK